MSLAMVTTVLPARFTVVTGSQFPLTTIKGNESLLTFTIPDYNFTQHLPATIQCIVKASADTPDASAIATIPATITDPAGGTFTIQVTQAATASAGRYFWKLKISDTSPVTPMTLMSGDFVVVNA